MSDTGADQTDWEHLLSAASRLQRILPEAVLARGSAAAPRSGNRKSSNTDHTLTDIRDRFDRVLAQLESVAGCKKAQDHLPVPVSGSLYGIETCVRQLIRSDPLETTAIKYLDQTVTVPTEQEILRIKAVLILKRNAMRDYLDFAALGSRMAEEDCVQAMEPFDRLYPQDSGQSALQQLLAQLSAPAPFDSDQVGPTDFRDLAPELSDWKNVDRICVRLAQRLFEGLCPQPTQDNGPAEAAGTGTNLPDPFDLPSPFG